MNVSTNLKDYFGCKFSYCCPHLYYVKLKYKVLTAVLSGLFLVSFVCLGI